MKQILLLSLIVTLSLSLVVVGVSFGDHTPVKEDHDPLCDAGTVYDESSNSCVLEKEDPKPLTIEQRVTTLEKQVAQNIKHTERNTQWIYNFTNALEDFLKLIHS